MADDYPNTLVWCDVETTGLRETSQILELGLLLTTPDLVRLDSRSWVIHVPAARFEYMDEWCWRQHGASGLLAEVAVSKLSLEGVRTEALSWLGGMACEAGKAPMCGASVHFDRAMLKRWMPTLEAWFYYGNLDVSSIQKLARYWYPELEPWEDRGLHRVDPDNEDAVAELRFYRDHLFRAQGLASETLR